MQVGTVLVVGMEGGGFPSLASGIGDLMRAKGWEQICSWHQDRAITDRKGLGEGVRDSQSPHGDGRAVGI